MTFHRIAAAVMIVADTLTYSLSVYADVVAVIGTGRMGSAVGLRSVHGLPKLVTP